MNTFYFYFAILRHWIEVFSLKFLKIYRKRFTLLNIFVTFDGHHRIRSPCLHAKCPADIHSAGRCNQKKYRIAV